MAWVKLLFRSVGEACAHNGLRRLRRSRSVRGSRLRHRRQGRRTLPRTSIGSPRTRRTRSRPSCHTPRKSVRKPAPSPRRVCRPSRRRSTKSPRTSPRCRPCCGRRSNGRPIPAASGCPFLCRSRRPRTGCPFSPMRLPRFQAGDRPTGVGAWERPHAHEPSTADTQPARSIPASSRRASPLQKP